MNVKKIIYANYFCNNNFQEDITKLETYKANIKVYNNNIIIYGHINYNKVINELNQFLKFLKIYVPFQYTVSQSIYSQKSLIINTPKKYLYIIIFALLIQSRAFCEIDVENSNIFKLINISDIVKNGRVMNKILIEKDIWESHEDVDYYYSSYNIKLIVFEYENILPVIIGKETSETLLNGGALETHRRDVVNIIYPNICDNKFYLDNLCEKEIYCSSECTYINNKSDLYQKVSSLL